MKKKLLALFLGIVIILTSVFLFTKFNSSDTDTVENTVITNEIIKDIVSDEIPDGTIINEESVEIEGFEEEPEDFVSGSIKEDEDDFVVGVQSNQPIYYSQLDSRWKNKPYTSTGNKTQTIGSSGCGPTSGAMVVSTIKGIVYPDEMAELYVKYGFRSANNGTYASAFQWTADKYGIEFQRVYNVNDAINLVRNNHMVVVSVSNGLFTTGGHYIVIAGIDGNTLKIYDPYLYNGKFEAYGRAGKVTVSGTTVYCSIDNFIKYGNSKGYFGFKMEENTDQNKFTSGRVLVDMPVLVAYQPSLEPNSKTLVDNDGYQFWITNSVLVDNNRIYGLGDIAYDGGSTDIVQIFDDQFWCKEIYMSVPIISDTIEQTPTTPTKQEESKPTTKKYVLGKYRTNTGLNVRSGPGTKYKIKKTYKSYTRFDTYEIKNGWARTPSGWVSLNYCTLIKQY